MGVFSLYLSPPHSLLCCYLFFEMAPSSFLPLGKTDPHTHKRISHNQGYWLFLSPPHPLSPSISPPVFFLFFFLLPPHFYCATSHCTWKQVQQLSPKCPMFLGTFPPYLCGTIIISFIPYSRKLFLRKQQNRRSNFCAEKNSLPNSTISGACLSAYPVMGGANRYGLLYVPWLFIPSRFDRHAAPNKTVIIASPPLRWKVIMAANWFFGTAPPPARASFSSSSSSSCLAAMCEWAERTGKLCGLCL